MLTNGIVDVGRVITVFTNSGCYLIKRNKYMRHNLLIQMRKMSNRDVACFGVLKCTVQYSSMTD